MDTVYKVDDVSPENVARCCDNPLSIVGVIGILSNVYVYTLVFVPPDHDIVKPEVEIADAVNVLGSEFKKFVVKEISFSDL